MSAAGWASHRVRRARSLLRRSREVDAGSMTLLVRTFLLLLGAKLALQWLPVRKVIAWKQREPATVVSLPAAARWDWIRRVRWAVLVVSRYSPIAFVCFPRCLAASALLRERGVASRLHYGVTRAGDRLITHTWLEAAGETVIGGEVADQFSTLAVY